MDHPAYLTEPHLLGVILRQIQNPYEYFDLCILIMLCRVSKGLCEITTLIIDNCPSLDLSNMKLKFSPFTIQLLAKQ